MSSTSQPLEDGTSLTHAAPLCSTPDSFPLFAYLPQELRSKIWRASLHRKRLIEISIECPAKAAAEFETRAEAKHRDEAKDPPAAPDAHEHAGRKGAQFRPFVRGRNIYSKLLRVNQEARREVHKFYRVQIRCQFIGVGWRSRRAVPKALPHILLFNPEYDFLYISERRRRDAGFGPDSMLVMLVAFLDHVRTSLDPRNVGVRNLALDLDSVDMAMCQQVLYLRAFWPAPKWEASARETFAKNPEALQKVFFIIRVGQRYAGPQSVSGAICFNGCTPMRTHTPSFTRLLRDPRPIDPDLKRAYTAVQGLKYSRIGDAHPKTAFRPWSLLLDQLGARAGETKYSWILSYKLSHYIRAPFSSSTPIRRRSQRWMKGDSDQMPGPAFGYWLSPLFRLL